MKLHPPPLENIAGDDYEITLDPQPFFRASLISKNYQLKKCSILNHQVHIETHGNKSYDFALESAKVVFTNSGKLRGYSFKIGKTKFKIVRLIPQMPELGWREFENRFSMTEGALSVFNSLFGF